MISISVLVKAVLIVIGVGLVCWLLRYAVDEAGISEPYNRVAKLIILLLGILVLIGVILWVTTGITIFTY